MCHHHPSFVDLSEGVGCVPPPLHHHHPSSADEGGDTTPISLGGKGVIWVCMSLYLELLSPFKARCYGGMELNVRKTEGAFMELTTIGRMKLNARETEGAFIEHTTIRASGLNF